MSADKSKLILTTIDDDGVEVPFGGGEPFAVTMPKKSTVVCVTLDEDGNEVPIVINDPDGAGPEGPAGPAGPEGPEGPAGADGADGVTPVITVGTVDEGAAWAFDLVAGVNPGEYTMNVTYPGA